jgi:hypothetical protein
LEPKADALVALGQLRLAVASGSTPPEGDSTALPPLPVDLVERWQRQFGSAPLPVEEPSKHSTSSAASASSVPAPVVRVTAERLLRSHGGESLLASLQCWWRTLTGPQLGLAFAMVGILVIAVGVLRNDTSDTAQPVLRNGTVHDQVEGSEIPVILVGSAADLRALLRTWEGPTPKLLSNSQEAANAAALSSRAVASQRCIVADAGTGTLTVWRRGEAAAAQAIEQLLPGKPMANLVLAVQNELAEPAK